MYVLYKWLLDVDKSSWDVKDVQLLYLIFIASKMKGTPKRLVHVFLHEWSPAKWGREKLRGNWEKETISIQTYAQSIRPTPQNVSHYCFVFLTLYIMYMQNEHVHREKNKQTNTRFNSIEKKIIRGENCVDIILFFSFL